jgi:hypothetical protein
MKYDRNYMVNSKEILQIYKKQWERNGSTIGSPEHLEYICSVLWQELFIQKSEDVQLVVDVTFNQSNNETIKHLMECLVGTTQNDVIRIIKNFQRTLLIIDHQLSKIRKLCGSDDPFTPILPENDRFWQLDTTLLAKLLEEGKNWDIDIEKKWWFFAKYFSFPALVSFSKDKRINLLDKYVILFIVLVGKLREEI